MLVLKQSTAIDIRMGPFVDATDGVTPETTVTLAGADQAEVLKANGAATSAMAGTFAAVTGSDGWYDYTVAAGDVDTVGEVVFVVQDASVCLPVFTRGYVVEEAIYDAMFAGSAAGFDANGRVDVGEWLGTAVTTSSTTNKPEVDVNSVSDDATAANNLELMFDGTGYAGGTTKLSVDISAQSVDDIWDESTAGHVGSGSFGARLAIHRSATAQAGAASTITLDASASATNDTYNNDIIYLISGTGAGQGNRITDYDGTTKIANVQDTWATNPDATSVFVIVADGSIPGASAPTAAQVADAVWDEATGDHTAEASFGALFYTPHSGTAQAGTATTITLDATGSSTTDDLYQYAFIKIVAGTGAGQSRQISAYNGTTKVATVSLNWTTTPSTDSQYVVMTNFGVDAATTAQIADAVWDEARAGHVSAGTFGEYVLADSTRVSGSTAAADGLEAAVAGSTPLPSNMTQISGDSVAADNLEAAFDGTGGVTISANIDGYAEIRTSGGTAGDNSADLVASILTTQMTESYAADGAAPTLAQALMAIQQRLFDADVVGTTLTVRQLDGTTAAMTLTLDNGSTPTDINRTG